MLRLVVAGTEVVGVLKRRGVDDVSRRGLRTGVATLVAGIGLLEVLIEGSAPCGRCRVEFGVAAALRRSGVTWAGEEALRDRS